jgi:acetyl esterase/lipase
MKTFIGKMQRVRTNPSPAIECFLPEKGRRNGIGLVIFPGGGYGSLASHEGKGYADFFSGKGISCFVVTYRLGGKHGNVHPAMLEDALSAVGTVRRRAAEFGVDPRRIGIIGSSAGGHLAAHTLASFGHYHHSKLLRPDFGILCYPVIMMTGKHCHRGSRINLVGRHPARKIVDEISCIKQVTAKTPPCFIWHTANDPVVPVENSILFASALKKNGVPFELHIYRDGPHGLGFRTELPWGAECLRWLKEMFPCGKQA